MGIMSYFSTTCETRELHPDAQLRTRYYRNNFKQCLEGLKQYAEEEHLEIRNVNTDHGEVYMLGNGYDMIVTVTQVTPIEAGIDTKINLFALSGLGRPKKRVLGMYKFLNSTLNFKGVSLHP
ncbi:MAG: hypothetical protein JXB20_05500 [Bacilli bacterium]|nr:hypothetical protein [Bacilli bacterium]MBN2696115.1 hypothetical protein [Bacilli bacterium]